MSDEDSSSSVTLDERFEELDRTVTRLQKVVKEVTKSDPTIPPTQYTDLPSTSCPSSSDQTFPKSTSSKTGVEPSLNGCPLSLHQLAKLFAYAFLPQDVEEPTRKLESRSTPPSGGRRGSGGSGAGQGNTSNQFERNRPGKRWWEPEDEQHQQNTPQYEDETNDDFNENRELHGTHRRSSNESDSLAHERRNSDPNRDMNRRGSNQNSGQSNVHGQQPHGQHPHGQHPNGQHPNAQHPNGQHLNGQHPHGQHPHGQHPHGQHPHGQLPHGQLPHGQQPHDQPAYPLPPQYVGQQGANVWPDTQAGQQHMGPAFSQYPGQHPPGFPPESPQYPSVPQMQFNQFPNQGPMICTRYITQSCARKGRKHRKKMCSCSNLCDSSTEDSDPTCLCPCDLTVPPDLRVPPVRHKRPHSCVPSTVSKRDPFLPSSCSHARECPVCVVPVCPPPAPSFPSNGVPQGQCFALVPVPCPLPTTSSPTMCSCADELHPPQPCECTCQLDQQQRGTQSCTWQPFTVCTCQSKRKHSSHWK